MTLLKSIESHVVGIVAGAGTIIAAFLAQLGSADKLGLGAIGGVVLAVAVAAGTIKNKSVSVASIQNAGTETSKAIAAALPAVEAVHSFVTTEWPQSKQLLSDLGSQVTALQQQVAKPVADAAAIAEQAASILQAKLASAPAPT